MPLDPRARRLLAMLALGAGGRGAPITTAERRASFKSLMALSSAALARDAVPTGDVRHDRIDGAAGPLDVRIYSPPGSTDAALLPGLVFFHGGGLVAGDLDTHDGLCRALAREAECRIVAVAYRLAPEHPFPAAVEDAFAAVRAVSAEAERWGILADRLGVAGDSAGGALATLAAWDAGGPALKVQVLLCPVLDLAERRPSRIAFGQGFMLDEAVMARDLADYLPEGVDPADPLVSPLRIPRLEGLPAALVHTAECDPVRDEGEVYAARLKEAGVPVRLTRHPGMIHHFVALEGLLPYTATALRAIGAEIRAALAK